jgi:hypothetical protein
MKGTGARKRSAVAKAPVYPEAKEQVERRGVDMRTVVRQWLLTTGDRGIVKLYALLQHVFNPGAETATEKRERLRKKAPGLYLYWVIAQLSGQDNERLWQDFLDTAKDKKIALSKDVDAELVSLVEELAAGKELKDATAGRIDIGPLRLISDVIKNPEYQATPGGRSDAWELVDYERLRRVDRLVFG